MRVFLALALALSGCAARHVEPPAPIVAPAEPGLPAALVGRVEVVPPDAPAYALAGVDAAVKPPGQGGVSEAVVVRLTTDLPVYRMWSGPEKLDAAGRTNRMGQWWTFDAPAGTQAEYRANYQICAAWNDLALVATCTLAAGAVVVVGPGQSVSAETCGDPDEAYAASDTHWQLFVARAWARPELTCPDPTADVRVDPGDLAAR